MTQQEDYVAIALKFAEILQDVMQDCKFKYKVDSYGSADAMVVALSVKIGDRIYGKSHMFHKHDYFLKKYKVDGALRELAVNLSTQVLDTGTQREQLIDPLRLIEKG